MPLSFLSLFVTVSLLHLYSRVRGTCCNNQSIKLFYFIVRLKVDERAGQLSLPHVERSSLLINNIVCVVGFTNVCMLCTTPTSWGIRT